MIKKYECKKCGKTGTRKDIRKHLREVHWVQAGVGTHKKNSSKERSDSQLTKNTKSYEFK